MNPFDAENLDAEFTRILEEAGLGGKRAPRHPRSSAPREEPKMTKKESYKATWDSLPAEVRSTLAESFSAVGVSLVATLYLAPRRFQKIGKLFGKDFSYRDGLTIYFALVYAGWALANGANTVKQSQKRADDLKAVTAKFK